MTAINRRSKRPAPRRALGLLTPLLGSRAVRFAAVGCASTLAYALLFIVLAPPCGAGAANVVALLVTAVANTAVNRTVTFGARGRARAVTHHVAGLAVFGVSLLLTSGALAVLRDLAPHASRAAELIVLLAATAVGTALRYTALAWIVAVSPVAGGGRLGLRGWR